MYKKDLEIQSAIKRLNDNFRRYWFNPDHGTVVFTPGIDALLSSDNNNHELTKLMACISSYDLNLFTEENDPWQEHDFGSFMFHGCKVIWKIDYYDKTMTDHSSNPADPRVTHRVMTVMLAEEY